MTCPAANAFATEQPASAFSARVMASHIRDVAGKGRLRLINLEHLAALDAMEISNALHNSSSFSGALAAGTGHLLHDGRIHPHPSRPRSHHDPSASDPRSTDLSPQSLRHAWPETCIGVFCGGWVMRDGISRFRRRRAASERRKILASDD